LNMIGFVEAWDKTWKSSPLTMPVMKFRNDSRTNFDTCYYLLTEMLNSSVHPYRQRFLEPHISKDAIIYTLNTFIGVE